MVFLSKTRERGIKALTKEKKKLQKLIEKKTTADEPVQAQPTPTVVVPVQLPSTPIVPIHVNLPLQTDNLSHSPPPPYGAPVQFQLKLETKPSTPSTPFSLSGSPWWVSDVTFIVEEKKIPCHRVVLQSRSEYFTQLFSSSNTSDPVTLEVIDFSHHTFTLFVRWVYGGKKEILLEDAPELARCARFYQAPELLSLCEKLMEEAAPIAPFSFPLTVPLPLHSSSPEPAENISPPSPPSPIDMTDDVLLPLESSHETEELQFYSVPHIPSFHNQLEDFDMNHAMLLGSEPGSGMHVWSNDPLLFSSELTYQEPGDSLRSMEIC